MGMALGMALALAPRLRGRLPWPKTVCAIDVQYPQPFPRVLSLPRWERGHGIL